MAMVTIQGQTLTERQKGLAACACLMAQGDMERLEPAVQMALNNGVTINQVAYKLGFQYPQHFTRLFKQQVGVTPSEYRN